MPTSRRVIPNITAFRRKSSSGWEAGSRNWGAWSMRSAPLISPRWKRRSKANRHLLTSLEEALKIRHRPEQVHGLVGERQKAFMLMRTQYLNSQGFPATTGHALHTRGTAITADGLAQSIIHGLRVEEGFHE